MRTTAWSTGWRRPRCAPPPRASTFRLAATSFTTSRRSCSGCDPRAMTRAMSSPAPVGEGALWPGLPLGLYVHFPFCGVRCPYCDFAVDTRADIPHGAYADAVIAEIGARRAWFAGAAPLVSIYFGGGTPGLWRPDALGRVIAAGRAAFGDPPADSLEITVEANPGEVDGPRLGA